MKKENYVKEFKNKDGYVCVNLFDKKGVKHTERVDMLVAQAFVPNPHNYKNIRHIDGNLDNNCADNLEWVE